jgi:DNA-binding NarL/FixJ family response regulator
MAQGDYRSAGTLYEQSLKLRRELGQARDVAASLNNLGIIAQLRGEYALAREYHEESLAVNRELGDHLGIANSLASLGNLANDQGDLVAAHALHAESLAVRRELRDDWAIRVSLNNLGDVAYLRGEYALALVLHEESLTISRALGDQAGIGDALNNLGLAALAAAESRPERAAQLFGAAEAVRDRLGLAQSAPERVLHDRDVAGVRAALNETAFAAAWTEGGGMPLEAVLAYALGDGQTVGPATDAGAAQAIAASPVRQPAPLPARLTAREAEVLRLIAAGHTNREIAEALVLAQGTVERHINNLYAKIGARRRADATAYPLRNGLA